MSTYRVFMEHWSRHEPSPDGAICIEHVEVVVDGATSGTEASETAKKVLGPEWKLRCVMIESGIPQQGGA